MNRKARDNRDRYTSLAKPVEKIELSEKHPKVKIFIVVLLAVVGAGFLSYAFVNFLNQDEGWSEIQASTSSELNCSEDFVFQYNLSDGGIYKNLQEIYTDACVKAYKLFNIDEEDDDYKNVCYINNHPNQEIVVDDLLYSAFEKIESCGDRSLYLGPVYDYYDNVFYSENETELLDYDPYLNDELKAEFSELARFASEDSQIKLELMGDNRVKLVVSQDYLEYAKANSVANFIDFYWMKNAFIIDYIADTFISSGYTSGIISSTDGYTRALGSTDDGYACNLYNLQGDTVYVAGDYSYNEARSMVTYRAYGISDADKYRVHEQPDGEIRTKYLSLEDGLDRSALSEFVVYSDSLDCSDVLLSTKDYYIADDFDADSVTALAKNNINSIFIQDSVVYYTEKELEIKDLYESDNVTFTAQIRN